MTPRRKNTPRSIEWIVSELDGALAIGAGSLIRDQIRQLLAHPGLNAAEFWEAIRAIGTQAHPRRWRSQVETSFKRLSATDQRLAGTAMLAFYHMIWDPKAALPFCSLQDLREGSDIMFAMDVLLDLERLTKARAVAKKGAEMLSDNHDVLERDSIIAALASYQARTRKWKNALELWTSVSRNGPLAHNAAVGSVEAYIAIALDTIDRELASISSSKRSAPQDREAMLSVPGNEEAILNDTEKDLLRLKRELRRVLAEKRRHALGLLS